MQNTTFNRIRRLIRVKKAFDCTFLPSGPAFRPRHVAPDWICEFIESARFHPVIAYDFARPAHINCLESRTVKTLTKLACRTSPDTRIATLIDSRVTIGAGAKGRSSSTALNRIQQGSLGYVLGGGLYLGGLYAPTGIHRADDPTRRRAIRSPRIVKPAWLSELEAENFARFDIVLFADRLCRPWNLWCRLLLLAGVGSSPDTDAELSARPFGAMAQHGDATPLLPDFSLVAAPAAAPELGSEPLRTRSPWAPAATSKARPRVPESVRGPPTSRAPGSAFALGAVCEGGTSPLSSTIIPEAPGLRSLLCLERDVKSGTCFLKALKRSARARARAEVHQRFRDGASSAASEPRSTSELLGSSAATQTAEGAAEFFTPSPASRGPPKHAPESEAQKLRRRQRPRLKQGRQFHVSNALDSSPSPSRTLLRAPCTAE